jgi:hypothetical protein
MVQTKPLKDFALSEDIHESVKINIYSLSDDATKEEILRNLMTSRKLMRLTKNKVVQK